MQKIVVTSDLSVRSRPAIQRAVELATTHGAELIALSVVNDDLPGDLARALRLGTETILKEQIDEDRAGRPLDIDIRVTTGDPLAIILEQTEDIGADLLVVGAHRRRPFLDQIRETTVEHVIRASRTPVLLVAGKGTGGYDTVLAGTAFSETCTALFRTVPKVAPGAQVTWFNAHPASFAAEAQAEFDTWLSVYGLPKDSPPPVFFEGSPQDALESLIEDASFDLLAIGGHTRADGGRYFIGRFTAGLIRRPPCDLLIAK